MEELFCVVISYDNEEHVIENLNSSEVSMYHVILSLMHVEHRIYCLLDGLIDIGDFYGRD